MLCLPLVGVSKTVCILKLFSAQGVGFSTNCVQSKPSHGQRPGRASGPKVPGLETTGFPRAPLHSRPGTGTLQSPKKAWGWPGRDSEPRCSPGLLRARALGAEASKDLWAEGTLRGPVGRGHALCSGLAVKDRTEPQEIGPCPYFSSEHNLGPPSPPQAPLTP